MGKPRVSVCFTPDLLRYIKTPGDAIVVVVDILRATTSMCTAMAHGAKAMIPVSGSIDKIKLAIGSWQLAVGNYLIAGERDGIKLPFADLGNSPLEFKREVVASKVIIFSTTNGTRAIQTADKYGEVYIGSFVNYSFLKSFLEKERRDVICLCAGWKGQFSLEDTLFAGKLTSQLVESQVFDVQDDAARVSVKLWQSAGNRLQDFARMSSHYQRLLNLESEEGLRYCFEPPEAEVLPKLEGERLVDWKIG